MFDKTRKNYRATTTFIKSTTSNMGLAVNVVGSAAGVGIDMLEEWVERKEALKPARRELNACRLERDRAAIEQQIAIMKVNIKYQAYADKYATKLAAFEQAEDSAKRAIEVLEGEDQFQYNELTIKQGLGTLTVDDVNAFKVKRDARRVQLKEMDKLLADSGEAITIANNAKATLDDTIASEETKAYEATQPKVDATQAKLDKAKQALATMNAMLKDSEPVPEPTTDLPPLRASDLRNA